MTLELPATQGIAVLRVTCHVLRVIRAVFGADSTDSRHALLGVWRGAGCIGLSGAGHL